MPCAVRRGGSSARLRLGRAQQRQLMHDNPRLQRRPDRERAYGAGGEVVSVQPLNRRGVSRSAGVKTPEARAEIAAAKVPRSRVYEILGNEVGFASYDAAWKKPVLGRAIRCAAKERYARVARKLILSDGVPGLVSAVYVDEFDALLAARKA